MKIESDDSCKQFYERLPRNKLFPWSYAVSKINYCVLGQFSASGTPLFYENKLYKDTQAEICPKIKNKLRTITGIKFWSGKFKKLILKSIYKDWDVRVYKELLD